MMKKTLTAIALSLASYSVAQEPLTIEDPIPVISIESMYMIPLMMDKVYKNFNGVEIGETRIKIGELNAIDFDGDKYPDYIMLSRYCDGDYDNLKTLAVFDLTNDRLYLDLNRDDYIDMVVFKNTEGYLVMPSVPAECDGLDDLIYIPKILPIDQHPII